jgi:subtilisin family serine protease
VIGVAWRGATIGRVWLAALTVATLTSFFSVVPILSAENDDVREWIVSLEQSNEDVRGHARALTKKVGRLPKHIYEHALDGFSFRGTPKEAEKLARDKGVRAVVQSTKVSLAAETTPTGIRRVDARHPTAVDAHEAGFRGAGVSVAIIDTGIDLDHPDLAANIDVARGKNCIGAGPPDDDHGHGTHVAGTVAAVADNGLGVVGIAPAAKLVPVKVLDSTGNGTTANVICGVDHLTALREDANPSNDVLVANMSLGDTGGPGTCTDGLLRQAICEATAAGITFVVAAGNSTTDTSNFFLANYPEVIAVSATNDTDGEPGGLGGCTFFGFFCDDELAFFSNYGSDIDVTAPGVGIFSTWRNGGYQSSDGTSMASPHVAGIAALVVAARPSLTPADVKAVIIRGGECPDGTWVNVDGDESCAGQGQRGTDPDGIAEPMANALRAAQLTATYDPLPSVQITAPVDGSSVAGIVTVSASAGDNGAVETVRFSIDGTHLAVDATAADGWSATWDTEGVPNGLHEIRATAVDDLGQTNGHSIHVRTGPPPGDWVGTYGVDGYALAAWNGSTDLALLPGASLTLVQGARYQWAASTQDIRALESPDETTRRAGTWYHATAVQLRIGMTAAYAGTLHLYALDWDGFGPRRETITVDDGRGAQSVSLTGDFIDGAWTHFPINVAAGGSVTISATRTGGENAVLSGIFLGNLPTAPATAPGAPTGLGASPGNGSAQLAWTAPASTGGSPITGYRVYRGTTPGGTTFLTALGVVTGFADSSLTNGTTYYYVVRAVNAIGEGGPSNQTQVTPRTVPTAPRNLSARAARPRGNALTWQVPSSNGGSAVTGYRIYRGTTSGNHTLLASVGTGTQYTDTATTSGVRYYYVVRAVNAAGEGPPSSQASAVAR